jgi:hypothetical protein
MAVHLLKESIFWAAEKGFRENDLRICQKQRKKYQIRLDQLWCCVRILLKPETWGHRVMPVLRATVHTVQYSTYHA